VAETQTWFQRPPYEPRESLLLLHFISKLRIYVGPTPTIHSPASRQSVTNHASGVRDVNEAFLMIRTKQRLEPNLAKCLGVKVMLRKSRARRWSPSEDAPQQPSRKLRGHCADRAWLKVRETDHYSEIARTLHCNPDSLGRGLPGNLRLKFDHRDSSCANAFMRTNLLLPKFIDRSKKFHGLRVRKSGLFSSMFVRFLDMQPNQFRLLHPSNSIRNVPT